MLKRCGSTLLFHFSGMLKYEQSKCASMLYCMTYTYINAKYTAHIPLPLCALSNIEMNIKLTMFWIFTWPFCIYSTACVCSIREFLISIRTIPVCRVLATVWICFHFNWIFAVCGNARLSGHHHQFHDHQHSLT